MRQKFIIITGVLGLLAAGMFYGNFPFKGKEAKTSTFGIILPTPPPPGPPPPPPPPPAPAPSPSPSPSPSPAPSGGGSGYSYSTAPLPGSALKNERPAFVTVKEEDFEDLKKIPAKDKLAIFAAVNKMLEYKTYALPKNKKFNPKKITKNNFAASLALAVNRSSCGSSTRYPGKNACVQEAHKKKLFDQKSSPDTGIRRIEFYDMLLKSIGAPLKAKITAEDLKKECKDTPAKITHYEARVYFTARELKIAPKYSKGRCLLHLQFPQTEATQFAVSAQHAGKKF